MKAEILDARAGVGFYWLMLDCGHWFKWTSANPPDIGSDFDCPTCSLPKVVVPLSPSQETQ